MPYEFNAQQYRQSSDTQQIWGKQVIAELNLQGHEQILDLGCGDGRLTALLAKQVPQGSVLGIDASTNMIALAQESFPRDNLRFLCMDINNLQDKERYDIIYSNAALHWILDHHHLLQAIYRALKPGGQVFTSFASDRNCINFKASLQETMSLPPFAEALQNFPWPWFMPSAGEYETIANTIPFTEARVWIQPNDRVFPNAATLTAWIDNPCLIPFLEFLPQHLGSAFRDEVVQRMISKTKQSDGTCIEIFNRLRFQARK